MSPQPPQLRTDYKDVCQYKRYVIKSFPYCSSGGGFVQSPEPITGISYYRYHVFLESDIKTPLFDAFSVDNAKDYIDSVVSHNS